MADELVIRCPDFPDRKSVPFPAASSNSAENTHSSSSDNLRRLPPLRFSCRKQDNPSLVYSDTREHTPLALYLVIAAVQALLYPHIFNHGTSGFCGALCSRFRQGLNCPDVR